VTFIPVATPQELTILAVSCWLAGLLTGQGWGTCNPQPFSFDYVEVGQ
jgi:hypothetical protein